MFSIYKIYYTNEENCVYIGKTKQSLQTRLYQHFHKHLNARSLDIYMIDKIEFAQLKTESDMNLYELYEIAKNKPRLNKDNKSNDELTIQLPEIDFVEFRSYLINQWKNTIAQKDFDYKEDQQQKIRMAQVFWDEQKIKRQTLSNEEYLDWLNSQEYTLNYKYAKEFRSYKI